MSTKPGRKPRSGRAASLKTVTLWDRTTTALSDKGVLVRLGIVTIGLIGFLFAVRGWKPLFPYRVGDRLERGIVARVDFKKVNRPETDRARRESEAGVAYVFRRNPAQLDAIPARLRTHLGAVAEAGSIASLPPEVRKAFRLETDSSSGGEPEFEDGKKKPLPEPPETRFAKIKTAIAGEGVVGERLDQIQKDFESFLEPLRQFGLLELGDLKPEEILVEGDEIQLDHAIQILGETDEDSITATVADGVLKETIKGTGRVGSKWTSFPRLVAMRSLLEVWMTSELPTTLQYAAAETQENRRQARENAGERFDTYNQGSVLIEPGTVLDEELLQLLTLEHQAVGDVTPLSNRVVRGAMAFLMFGILAVLFGSYLNRTEPQIVNDPKHLAVFLTLCVATVWLSRLVSIDPWRAEIIPLLAAVMLLAIAYDQVLATLCAFVLSVVISLATVATLEHFVVLMVVSVVSVAPLNGVSSRSSLIKTGFLVAAVYFAVAWAAGILGQREDVHWSDWDLFMNSLRGAGWCLVCCYLVAGTLPLIERRFGIVTDISLLELCDISHPLLQELVRRAPGTYNHSIAVATIGEAAAEAIGANGLLVRVGAYFHDIGKMLKPEYFIENNTAGEGNRHKSLAPAMSTLIIIGHVKDGIELANEHNLPKQIVDFIEQHHGTTLVEYFFHEATRQADEDHKSEADEANFRYPGPKPQTREAGIMMLTDAVESASRTLSEPTPKRIENLVHEILMKRLHDGQFDECNLTLAEIHTIEETLVKSLIGIYHGRVKYPEQRTA
jgi:putative nucleotidyltransferase with HDIG domain